MERYAEENELGFTKKQVSKSPIFDIRIHVAGRLTLQPLLLHALIVRCSRY